MPTYEEKEKDLLEHFSLPEIHEMMILIRSQLLDEVHALDAGTTPVDEQVSTRHLRSWMEHNLDFPETGNQERALQLADKIDAIPDPDGKISKYLKLRASAYGI